MTRHSPLDEAVAFAQAHEIGWPRDPLAMPSAAPSAGSAAGAGWGIHHDDPPPYNRLRGPVHARGPQSG
ncbi:MAG: hypothetical protein ABIN96_08225, partial [Rubrivivax sp.]